MTNSPTFKLLDLPSVRRASPWDLRQQAREIRRTVDFELDEFGMEAEGKHRELLQLADFRESQLFESGARLKERLED